MNLEEALRQITPPDERAGQEAKARWDSIAKPLGSLGLLEEAVIRIAALTGSARAGAGQALRGRLLRRQRRGSPRA